MNENYTASDDITLSSKILVVDDSLLILTVIRRMLEHKYDVRIAQSAREAYQLLEECISDLILLDVEMPEVNGYEFLRQIKSDQRWNNIPVIFLTGMNDQKSEEKALNMGAVDYILKPISEGVLKKRVQLHLELTLYRRELEGLVDIKTKQLLETQEALRSALKTAEEASRMKSVFLANMSHELRTPMNGIIGFSELALNDATNPKIIDYLEKIKGSSEGLLEIINNILDISKIEAGKITLESIPFDIHYIFRACQTIITPKALEKGIALFCYAEPSIGKKLLGDPTRLRQALLNLLSNAVKFTTVGIVKLLSSIKDVNDDNITIHFEVKDSGIGMTQQQMDRIFIPFVQGDGSTTRKYGGTGLGLAITKNLIELMGGSLRVESALGIGSKFSFDVTFKTIDVDSDDTTIAAPVAYIEKPLFKGDILVCEDNVMNQQVICDHLSRVGLNTIIAQNGKEGIECVRRRIANKEQPFELIFMDVHMPVMDGLEASQQLLAMGISTPIVTLTANIMTTDKELYKNAGMPDCLAKPYTAQELWNCLLRHITPIGKETSSEKAQAERDSGLRNKLLTDFLEDNRQTFANISLALDAGDVKLAHRYAHTLKGTAGLIGKTDLQQAAYAVELSLANGKRNATREQLDELKTELERVINELSLTHRKSKNAKEEYKKEKKDAELCGSLLEKLEPKLMSGELECLDFIDELREFPDMELLITQIEHYDFASACETLAEVKKSYGNAADE